MTTFSDDSEMLLDRDRDFEEARALIAEARAISKPAVLRITGPAGIGKTVFLRRLVAKERAGRRAIWLSAESGEQSLPRATLYQIPGLQMHAEASEDEFVDLVGGLLAKIAVVCIDDAQWLDEISRRVVMALLEVNAPKWLLLFGDRREDAPDLPPHRSVQLGPLRAKSAADLVRRHYPQVTSTVLSEIVSAAAGLPFAAAFLAGQAATARTRSTSGVDSSVRAALERRLTRCSNDARETVRHAALLEAPFALVPVAQAVGISVRSASRALTELADLVTVKELRADFRHAVIRDAVRASITDPVAYFARLLPAFGADDGRLETLDARLRCAQGCGEYGIAAACALQAGRALAAIGSLETSLEYLEVALHHVSHPIPPAYAVEYAGVLLQLSRDERAAVFLREQIRFAIDRGDVRTAAQLMVPFFSAAVSLERFDEFFAIADRVARLADLDAESQQRLRSARLAALAFSGRFDEYERYRSGAPLSWVDHRPAAFIAAINGDDAHARSFFDAYQAELRSEHARQAPTDRVLRTMIELFHNGTGALSELGDLGRRVRTHPSSAALRILCHFAEARWDAARTIVADVPLWSASYEEPYDIVGIRLMVAALTRRDVAEPLRTLHTLRSMIARSQTRHVVSAARWYLATEPSNGSHAADIAAFVGDTLDVPPMPYLVAGLPLSISLLHAHYGRRACASALKRWPYSGSRWHRAQLDLACGLVEHDHARLRSARDAFDILNAPAFAMIAGTALPIPRATDVALARSLDMTRPDIPKRPLTPRERDIAELAAAGKGNREIATTLDIAERTVEVHLTNAFKKLGVRSRTALAHYLAKS